MPCLAINFSQRPMQAAQQRFFFQGATVEKECARKLLLPKTCFSKQRQRIGRLRSNLLQFLESAPGERFVRTPQLVPDRRIFRIKLSEALVLFGRFLQTAQRRQRLRETLRGLAMFRLQAQNGFEGLECGSRFSQLQAGSPEKKPRWSKTRVKFDGCL